MTKRWLLLVLLSACAAPPSESEPIREEAPSADAHFRAPQPVTTRGLLDAPARVIASSQASAVVSTSLEARVVQVRVQPGQRVEANAPVVDVLMPEALRAAGALSAASLRAEAYQARLEKLSPLVKDGLARASELFELSTNLTLARADVASAQATLRTAGLTDKEALSLLSGRGILTLRSPIAGMVTVVSARRGEVRAPASGPLIEIVGEAPTRVEARFASLPPASASLVWKGAGAEIPLEIEAVAPSANEVDGSRSVWLRAKGDEQALTAGTLGRVRIVPRAAWRSVPARALVTTDKGARVRVKRGAETVWVDVEVVLRGTSDVVVTGLEAEDLVASDVGDAL
jgi:hypothetical protein